MTAYSVIEWFGSDANRGHHCGYCDSAHGSLTHGMWGHRLQTAHYAQLLNRGWRRSGKFLYHPVMDRTCCPQYAIRISANEFKPTKSQKKVVRKMNKFLMYGKQPQQDNQQHASGDDEADGDGTNNNKNFTLSVDAVPRPGQSPNRLSLPMQSASLPASKFISTASRPVVLQNQQHNTEAYSVSPIAESRISKKPRINARRDKPKSFAASPVAVTATAQPGSARDSCTNGNNRNGRVPAVSINNIAPCASDASLKKSRNHVSVLYNRESVLRPQNAVGTETRDEPQRQNAKQASGEKSLQELFATPNEGTVPPVHRLELRLMRTSPPSAAFKATLKEEYAVYARYESVVHRRRDLSERQFTRFLIDSPLVCEYHPRQRLHPAAVIGAAFSSHAFSEEPLLGSYHQQYVLDGRIIAVDVIDILPGCVTSVYFFYDPDYSFLSLGTYSVLREAVLVQELNQHFPDIKYISLGYYVHSCSKMQYKSRFHPSELVCPETYTWHPIEKCLPSLELGQYQRFSPAAVHDDEGERASAASVLVFFQSMPIPYPVYQNCITQLGGDGTASLTEVRTYAKLVGRTLAGEMLLYREPPVST